MNAATNLDCKTYRHSLAALNGDGLASAVAMHSCNSAVCVAAGQAALEVDRKLDIWSMVPDEMLSDARPPSTLSTSVLAQLQVSTPSIRSSVPVHDRVKSLVTAAAVLVGFSWVLWPKPRPTAEASDPGVAAYVNSWEAWVAEVAVGDRALPRIPLPSGGPIWKLPLRTPAG